MNTKLTTITKEGFSNAYLFQHSDGVVTLNLALANGVVIRLTTTGEASVCGYTKDGVFYQGDLEVEDGAHI